MRQTVVAIAAGMLLAASTFARQTASSPASSGRRLALLVGVTEFLAPAMKRYALEGPANDVTLVRTLLTSERFNIPADAITTLAGLPAEETARPTRANIERAFRRLSEIAGRGDQVLILLAGHGSQQPADPDPTDDEPDGLDEIFLPADVSGWDGKAGRVVNAITDDDIRQWVTAIRRKGAIVSILVDACHSGTITRGGPSAPRERGIPASELIPAEVLARAVPSVTRSSAAQAARAESFDLARDEGDIAALYAADVAEGTPELTLPDRDGPVHGLFTYTVARVLAGATEPITYRELVQRVIDSYRAEGYGPTPSFEGAAIDRYVLGEEAPRDRPAYRITARDGNRWSLAAGSLHGLTSGSILEVFSGSVAARATAVGHLRVVEVSPTTAVATPVSFGNMPAPRAEQLTTDSRARVVFHDFGVLRVRVALQRSIGASRGVEAFEAVPPGRGPERLERALSSLESLSLGLAVRGETADADWFLRVSNDRVTLTSSKDRTKHFDVASVADEQLPAQLADKLTRIARVANLSRLSTSVDPEAALQAQLLWSVTPEGLATPVLTGSSMVVKPGQFVQLRLKNVGQVPLDVTVLYVDANFQIQALFPQTDAALDNRIDAGRDRAIPLGTVTADPAGWESVVAIGVESTLQHENFRVLEQPALPEERRGPVSPLRALLYAAAYGTRGGAPGVEQDRGRFAIVQTWFRVER